MSSKNAPPYSEQQEGIIARLNGPDIAVGFQLIATRFKMIIALCGGCRCNRKAFLEFRDRLFEMADLMFGEKGLASKSESIQENVPPLISKYNTILFEGVTFIEGFTKEGFLNFFLVGNKPQQKIKQIDMDLASCAGKMAAAMGMAGDSFAVTKQYDIVCDVRTKIDLEMGGLEGVNNDPEKIAQLAAFIDAEPGDIASEVKEALQRLDDTLLSLDEDEANNEEVVQLTEAERMQLKKDIRTLVHQKVAAVAAQYNDSVLNLSLSAFPLKKAPQINRDNLIGVGKFSKIYTGKYSNELVAIKVINEDINAKDLNDLKRTILTQLKLRKVPGVLRFNGADLTSKDLKLVVMPYANGSLFDALHKHTLSVDLSLISKLSMLSQVASCLAYTEGLEIMHRDLQSRNIFLFCQESGRVTARVTNFTMPRKKTATESSVYGAMKADVGDDKLAGHLIPPPVINGYLAPELYYDNNVPTLASDVYAFGVLMNELLTEKRPFEEFALAVSRDDSEAAATAAEGEGAEDATAMAGLGDGLPVIDTEKIMIATVANERPAVFNPSSTSDATGKKLRKLVRLCWDQEEKKRLTFASIQKALEQLLQNTKTIARFGIHKQSTMNTSFTDQLLGDGEGTVVVAEADASDVAVELQDTDEGLDHEALLEKEMDALALKLSGSASVGDVMGAVQSLFSMMKKYRGAEGSGKPKAIKQEVAVAILDQVSALCTNADNLEQFGKSEETLSELLAVAASNKDSAKVSERAAEAIKLLCRYGTTIDTQNTRNISELAKLGACELLVDILSTHGKGNAHTTECGLFAIGNMSNNAENTAKFTALGARELAIELLKAHARNNIEVAQTALFAIGNLNIKSPTQTNVDKETCVLIAELLQTHGKEDAAIARYGSFAIASLALKNRDNTRNIAESGNPQALVELLRVHTEAGNVSVVHFVLLAISKLAGDGDVCVEFGELGACEIIIGAMKKFGLKNRGVTENGLAGVCNLSCNNMINCDLFNTLDAFDLITELVSTHGSTSTAVADTGLGAMCNLSVNYHDSNSVKYGVPSTSACSLILRMLREHGADSIAVADNGLGAVCNLSNKNPHNKEEFGKMGGCSIVLELLKLHGLQTESVADNGLGAITNLTNNHEENIRRFEALDCVQVVVSVMQAYALSSRSIALEGILAIINFTSDGDKVKTLAKDTPICELLLQIVAHYVTFKSNCDTKMALRCTRILLHFVSFKKQTVSRLLLSMNAQELLRERIIENIFITDEETKVAAQSTLLKIQAKRSSVFGFGGAGKG